MLKTASLYIICCYSLLLASACSGSDEASKYVPDVSKINTKAEILRFDEDLFNTNVANIDQLKQQYPAFASFYLDTILPNWKNTSISEALKMYQTDEYSKRLHDSVQLLFPDNQELEKEFTTIAKQYSYYFPALKNPFERVYTYTSAYRFGAFIHSSYGETYVAVGLDYALGENHEAYMHVDYLRYQYVRQKLTKAHLPVLAVEAAVGNIMEERVKKGGNYFIDFVIYNGKKYFLIDLLMPKTEDYLKLGYTKDQMAYCVPKEVSLYENLSKSVGFYSDDELNFRAYINPGPFNPEQNRHANAGSWLGMRIVQSYYRKVRHAIKREMRGRSNREIDRAALDKTLAEMDAQRFLKKYTPKR